MQEAFGWSETTKALVLCSFFIGCLLFQAPRGWLANRFGGKVVMGVAIAWWSPHGADGRSTFRAAAKLTPHRPLMHASAS